MGKCYRPEDRSEISKPWAHLEVPQKQQLLEPELGAENNVNKKTKQQKQAPGPHHALQVPRRQRGRAVNLEGGEA